VIYALTEAASGNKIAELRGMGIYRATGDPTSGAKLAKTKLFFGRLAKRFQLNSGELHQIDLDLFAMIMLPKMRSEGRVPACSDVSDRVLDFVDDLMNSMA
jgi:hypothetical protein